VIKKGLVCNASTPFYLENIMHIYSAYVRANGIVVQTQVCANNLSDAINLLKGAYGSDNLVHLPQLMG
jgi:hypothetical protein